MSTQPRLFVSHTHADNHWCRLFVARLREGGVDVWYDEENLEFARLTTEIQREIQTRPFFVVVLSPEAVTSEWVTTEWSAALTVLHNEPGQRILVSVLAQPCEVPLLLQTRRYIHLKATPEEAADELLTQVFCLALTSEKSLKAPVPTPRMTAEAAVLQGKSLLTQQRSQEALQAFDAALALDHQTLGAWPGKSDALQQLGQEEDAEYTLTQAIDIAPAHALFWSMRGQIRGRRNRLDEALNDVNHALTLDRTTYGAWNNKSNILRYLGRYEEALTAAEEAIRLDAQFGVAWITKGNALMRLGRHAEALASYELGTMLTTPVERLVGPPARNAAVGATNKGNAYFQLRIAASALICYEDALAQDTTYAPAWLGKGNALLQQRQYIQAIAAYQQAETCLGTTPNERAQAQFGQGVAYGRLNELDEAARVLRAALQLDPDLRGVRLELGSVCLHLQQYEEALAIFLDESQRSDRDGEDMAEAWNGVACAYAGLEKQVEALTAFQHAIECPGATLRPWVNRVHLLEQWGRSQEAQQALDDLVQHLYVSNVTAMQKSSRPATHII